MSTWSRLKRAGTDIDFVGPGRIGDYGIFLCGYKRTNGKYHRKK